MRVTWLCVAWVSLALRAWGDPHALDAAKADAAIAHCRADSGACAASTPCTGQAADRVCDPARLINAAEAIRIAQASGLANGLESRGAELVYNYGYRRIIWSVTNILEQSAPAGVRGRSLRGDAYVLDAVTGRVLAKLGWGRKP